MIAALFLAVCAQSPVRWNLVTEDTRATIEVADNRPIVAELGAAGDSHQWCTGSPVSLIDHVWSGGQETPVHWRFAQGAQADSKLSLTFRCEQPPLDLRSVWRARKGRGPIEHWIEITNHSKAAITIPQQESLNLDGVNPGGDALVWWIRRGASNAMTQGGTFQEPVKPGMDLDLVSDHHDGSSPVPWLAVQVGAERGLYLGWEFSSLGRLEAKMPSANSSFSIPHSSLSLRAGLMPDFKTDIHPGETLAIPAAFVGCYRGDIDEGSQSLHRFVMEKLRANPPKDFADPTTVCGIYLDAGGDHATEATLFPTVAFAKDLGLDTFLADAMWFPACGDWRWDPARFPRGPKPIDDAIHRAGMKFGLWCAWDNGGVSSDPGALSVRGPVGHPDWFGENLPPNWQPGPFYGVTACMGSPEAKAWAMKKTQSIVGDAHVDMLKTDVHPMINQCVQTNHRHTHGTDVGYWSTLGVYEVWDELRRKYPKLVLENCSGASHIKDFGVIQRCAYTATTDTLSNLPDRAGIYDSTFVLPPSALMTYTYERGYGAPGDDPGSYLFRSAMMTAWDLAPTDSKDWTAEEKAAGRAAVRTYKEWIRPILQDCKVHHVLPRPDGKHWDGMFFWSQKPRKGTLFVFRPDSAIGSQVVRLAGLDRAKKYLVWSEDGSIQPARLTGHDLMDRGIALELPAPYTSDIVHVGDAAVPMPNPWGAMGPLGVRPTKVANDYFGSTADLKWTAGLGARCFRVVVSDSPLLIRHIVERVVYDPHLALESSQWNSKVLPEAAVLYWRVEAIGCGGSIKSKLFAFNLLHAKPWPGVFLSDLPWVKAEAGSDQVHRNENYLGKRLSIKGKVYRKGIWTHSFNDGHPADIVFDIAGKGYGVFASDAGLDDASGGGSVQFQVLLDGKMVAESPIMRPHEVHRFRVDLGGTKTLTLRVLNGGDGYTSDHAVWGLARLMRLGGSDPFAKSERGRQRLSHCVISPLQGLGVGRTPTQGSPELPLGAAPWAIGFPALRASGTNCRSQ
ncbi:MAG: NPCBM/NEW2 domain-containing protein [Fimbriimonadales bacterium]